MKHEFKHDCMCDDCLLERSRRKVIEREREHQLNGPLSGYEKMRGGRVPPEREPKAK